MILDCDIDIEVYSSRLLLLTLMVLMSYFFAKLRGNMQWNIFPFFPSQLAGRTRCFVGCAHCMEQPEPSTKNKDGSKCVGSCGYLQSKWMFVIYGAAFLQTKSKNRCLSDQVPQETTRQGVARAVGLSGAAKVSRWLGFKPIGRDKNRPISYPLV